MSKQPLKFSLHPTAITMLERLLPGYDKSVLTRSQIAEIAPLRQALRVAREKMNLMARSEIVATLDGFEIYPHPDRRDQGSLMIYDKTAEDLHITTPFVDLPDADEIKAWIGRGATD